MIVNKKMFFNVIFWVLCSQTTEYFILFLFFIVEIILKIKLWKYTLHYNIIVKVNKVIDDFTHS